MNSQRQGGYSDFKWLKEQALDQETLKMVRLIEEDERAFAEEGVVTEGDEEMTLHFKQGTFHTMRATGHSIAHIFVHIFKNKEHMLVSGFNTTNKSVVVDIGANEGYYALSMAKNPEARIFAIEPNPIAYNLLSKNIEANHASNVTALDCAIWSSTGIQHLSILPQVTSIGTLAPIASSFMSSSQERVVQIPVQSITLSDLIETYNLNRIDLLKIDIEGGEFEVLQSSLSVLDIVDRIVIEYHSQQLRNDIIQLLSRVGYVLQMHAPDRANFGDLYFIKQTLLVNQRNAKIRQSLHIAY